MIIDKMATLTAEINIEGMGLPLTRTQALNHSKMAQPRLQFCDEIQLICAVWVGKTFVSLVLFSHSEYSWMR